MSHNNMQDIIDFVMAKVDELPDPPRERIKAEFAEIIEMISKNRPPRIMIIGRRGAGKSSLLNAVFQKQVAAVGSVLSETGAARWHTFANDKGEIRILDTRGIGDRTKPESSNFEHAIEEIQHEIEKECPDAVLFLCKAKEADAHIAEDLRNIVKIREHVEKEYNYDLPVVAAVTQIDELDPKRIEPPYEHETKQRNIGIAVKAITDAFTENHIDLLTAIPVSTYAEYENGRKVYDNFFNVDVLIEYLVQVLPKSAQLQMARLSKLKSVQKKVAKTLVHSMAGVCAGIAAVPIPVADIIPITSAQIALIIGVGYIGGKEISTDNAKEFLVAIGINVGAGLVIRELARGLIKLIPVAGNAVSSGMAYAGTLAIGEAAIAYFIDGVSGDEAKKQYERAKEKEAEKAEEEGA
ncbi:GTPase [Pusillimonas sp.]|uniref:GTPase n=1 Tax=Pusillimonas sp. TaxID=3040095 RepID=UPI0029BBB085|nr:GTPase [Pusillimonas sp.]MDX3894867.1 50S ribosome-binding GTPase [Pusillimonas sp.]